MPHKTKAQLVKCLDRKMSKTAVHRQVRAHGGSIKASKAKSLNTLTKAKLEKLSARKCHHKKVVSRRPRSSSSPRRRPRSPRRRPRASSNKLKMIESRVKVGELNEYAKAHGVKPGTSKMETLKRLAKHPAAIATLASIVLVGVVGAGYKLSRPGAGYKLSRSTKTELKNEGIEMQPIPTVKKQVCVYLNGQLKKVTVKPSSDGNWYYTQPNGQNVYFTEQEIKENEGEC